jgi:hypothetical protein
MLVWAIFATVGTGANNELTSLITFSKDLKI